MPRSPGRERPFLHMHDTSRGRNLDVPANDEFFASADSGDDPDSPGVAKRRVNSASVAVGSRATRAPPSSSSGLPPRLATPVSPSIAVANNAEQLQRVPSMSAFASPITSIEAASADSCRSPDISPLPEDVASEQAPSKEELILGKLRASMLQQRSRLDQLVEECRALRDCLVESGTICRETFLVRLHRRVFESARRRYPLKLSRKLPEVLQTHMLDILIARCVGFASTRELRAASRSVSQAAARALPAMGPAPRVAYVVGGWDGEKACADARRFDPTAGTWEVLPPMHERRCSAAAAVCGGQVYVLGGDEGTRPMDSAERFNTATDQWEVLPPMLERRQAPAAIAVMGKVYVLGGHDGRRSLATAERLDPAALTARTPTLGTTDAIPAVGMVPGATALAPSTNSGGASTGQAGGLAAATPPAWQALPALAERRQGVMAAVLAGQIYAIGGFDGNRTLSSAERLDLASAHPDAEEPVHALPGLVRFPSGASSHGDAEASCSSHTVPWATWPATASSSGTASALVGRSAGVGVQWVPIPAMRQQRASGGAAVLGGGIYILGGFDGTEPVRSVERYEPSTSAWTSLPSMARRRVGVSVASVSGVLYAFGGRRNEHLLGCLERFDPTTGLWELMGASLGQPRVYTSAVSAVL